MTDVVVGGRQVVVCAVGAAFATTLFAGTGSSADGFDPSEDRALRVTAEVGGAVAASGAGVLLGALLGDASCARPRGKGLSRCTRHAVIGGAVGGYATLGLGVWAGGELAGGNGGVGYAYLGEAAGLALGGGIFLALEAMRARPPTAVSAVFLIGLPLAGAILGYELSTEQEPSSGTSSSPLSKPATMVTVPFAF